MSNKGNLSKSQHDVVERFLKSLFTIMESVEDDMENASYCFDFNQLDESAQLSLLDYLKHIGYIEEGDYEGYPNSYKIAEVLACSIDSETIRRWNIDNEMRLFHYADGVLHCYYIGIDEIEPNLNLSVEISLREGVEYLELLSSEI